jgi:NAD(P)-dependent dehydrogenase (short-subunit alcohol dehydrogenase family)
MNGAERALVTGCSTGIGRATAAELARRGYSVIATARHVDALEGLDVAEKLPLDVTDDESVAKVAAQVGDVDVLVNNAGMSVWGPIETVPVEKGRLILETNVLGVIRVTQAFLPGMRERGRGAVVNMSSAAGRTGGSPILGWYAASKHALEVLTEALRFEVGQFGVRVILVEPGAIESNFPQNRQVVGLENPPYDVLGERFMANVNRNRGTTYPAADVATVVAEALAAESPRLRWYGSPDAEPLITARRSATDEEVEERMRRSLAG